MLMFLPLYSFLDIWLPITNMPECFIFQYAYLTNHTAKEINKLSKGINFKISNIVKLR